MTTEKKSNRVLAKLRTIVPLLLALASGATALSHELLWTHRLTDLLGASGHSTSKVLGTFFFGLCIGSILIARLLPRIRIRTWIALAGAEFYIALFSIPAMTLPDWSDGLWPWLGPDLLMSPLGAWMKMLICFIVVFPPALGMGATLPLFIHAITSESLIRSSRKILYLYAFNTLGGVLGIYLVLGWTLATFTVKGAMLFASISNIAIAVLALCLAKTRTGTGISEVSFQHRSSDHPKQPTKSPLLPKPRHFPQPSKRILLLGLAFFSGFGILASEVITIRMLMSVATLSIYASAVVLASVILTLAIGAFLSTIGRERRSEKRLFTHLGNLGIGSGFGLAIAPFVFLYVARNVLQFSEAMPIWTFVAKLSALSLITVGAPLLCAGIIFPLLIQHHTLTQQTKAPASSTAELLAFNGLGGLIGAEVGYQWILPLFGPYQGLGLVAFGYGLLGLLCLCRPSIRSVRQQALAMGACLAIAYLWHYELPRLPLINPSSGFRPIFEASSRSGTLAVADHPQIGRAMILDNQYILGSSVARYGQERQAHIPLLLHSNPERVGFIGVATGITPGAALAHEKVRYIEAIELHPDVARAAKHYFGDYNRQVMDHPNVHTILEDGRSYIRASQERFDVIIADLFLPWGNGSSRLYSKEHYDGVYDALRSGGLFCQWLPLYQLSEEQLTVIGNTMLSRFDELHLFRNQFDSDRPVLGLIGFKDRDLNWEVIDTRIKELRSASLDESSPNSTINPYVRDPSVRHIESMAMLYLGRTTDFNNSSMSSDDTPRINNLDHPWLEFDAAHQRITGLGVKSFLYHNRWLQVLQRQIRSLEQDKSIPQGIRHAAQLGYWLSLWEAAGKAKSPKEEKLKVQVQRRFPQHLRQDAQADWNQWPGKIPPS